MLSQNLFQLNEDDFGLGTKKRAHVQECPHIFSVKNSHVRLREPCILGYNRRTQLSKNSVKAAADRM